MLVLGVIVNCPNCNSNTIQKYKYTNTKYIKLILFLCRARVTTDHWRTHCRRIPSRWPAARWTPQTRSEKVRFVYYSALGKRWTLWRVNFFLLFFFLVKQMNALDTIRKTEFFSPIWVKGVWLFTLLAFRRHYRDASGVDTQGSIAL